MKVKMPNSAIFQCAACKTTFKRRWNLRQHEKTHLLERTRYKCDEQDCTKSFLRKEELTRHINTVSNVCRDKQQTKYNIFLLYRSI
ncbi:hypothetical protein M501DRAFT_605305 [Patellaria atrata CBS 101060]|uniref:C2H2-type domain-containing protein n=1 Tax=Patellaria atrata CBS 101060 TaxID=1346257 RepID=A0A9P4S2H1_9PEZI|nr:hypothetical protein M501DRAFT_605305 [Patellaria atrata CBS 101060]